MPDARRLARQAAEREAVRRARFHDQHGPTFTDTSPAMLGESTEVQDTLAKALLQLRNVVDEPVVDDIARMIREVVREARTRVTAEQPARTYRVEWSRPLATDGSHDERLVCSGLTERALVRRLVGAVRVSGAVTIHSLTHDEGHVGKR